VQIIFVQIIFVQIIFEQIIFVQIVFVQVIIVQRGSEGSDHTEQKCWSAQHKHRA
jgi:hypothetical protein